MPTVEVKVPYTSRVQKRELDTHLTPEGYETEGQLEQAAQQADAACKAMGRLLAHLVERGQLSFDDAESFANVRYSGTLVPEPVDAPKLPPEGVDEFAGIDPAAWARLRAVPLDAEGHAFTLVSRPPPVDACEALDREFPPRLPSLSALDELCDAAYTHLMAATNFMAAKAGTYESDRAMQHLNGGAYHRLRNALEAVKPQVFAGEAK